MRPPALLATDLWFSAADRLQRVRTLVFDDGVFPISAEARSLPFPPGFFDAIVSIDSCPYYGTDDSMPAMLPGS